MIVVIDYDVGNVKSVCNAFDYIGCAVELSRRAEVIRGAAGLVLPGVAAFGYAINALGGLAGVIKEVAGKGRPVLGICVGYQMLFERSCEYGVHEGLGLVSGDVVPLPTDKTVPHMGWNLVEFGPGMDLFAGLDVYKHFYFAHSFYAAVADDYAKVAYTEYGFRLPASVQKGNIYGTQFHPEKSGPNGLAVLRNFARICEGGGG
jgi:glutamine amidotransferase